MRTIFQFLCINAFNGDVCTLEQQKYNFISCKTIQFTLVGMFSETPSEVQVKMLMLGYVAAGKTSLIARFIQKRFFYADPVSLVGFLFLTNRNQTCALLCVRKVGYMYHPLANNLLLHFKQFVLIIYESFVFKFPKMAHHGHKKKNNNKRQKELSIFRTRWNLPFFKLHQLVLEIVLLNPF